MDVKNSTCLVDTKDTASFPTLAPEHKFCWQTTSTSVLLKGKVLWELVAACPEVKKNKYANHSLPTCKRGWWKSCVDRVLKFKSMNTGVVKDNSMELETDG